LAQLSGRPSLVEAEALTDVEAVVIPPERLRALLVAEAELGERIMRALILRRVGLIESGGGGPIIVGHGEQADVLRLANFLRRNGHPFQLLNPDEDGCAQTLVERFEVVPEELPIVLCPGGQLLRNPDENALARCIGLVGPIDPDRIFDVVVIGAGPSGLATAVYAGSEGLSVLALDCRSFGGQAGASSRIENYLGFPTGISGMALMGRAFSQAQKFGVEVAIPDEAVRLECGNDPCHIELATGARVQAQSVVIATGARYRRLGVEHLQQYGGAAVPSATSARSSAPSRTPIGSRLRGSGSTTAGSSSRGRSSATIACRWRPAGAACLPSAMCGPARSSALRPQSATAHRLWRRSTNISPARPRPSPRSRRSSWPLRNRQAPERTELPLKQSCAAARW